MNVTQTINSINSIEYNIPIVVGRIFNILAYSILIIFVLAVCYVAGIFVKSKIDDFHERKRRIIEEETEKSKIIRHLQNKRIEELSKEYLEKFIEELNKAIEKYSLHKELRDKHLDAEYFLKKRDYEQSLRDLSNENSLREKINYELREEGSRLWKKNEDMTTEREDILKFLEADENNVFVRKELNKKQIKVLLEEGYKHSNQYSSEDNKIVSVLIKPPLNHTPTHTFLVWSIRKLLKRIKGAEEIRDHDTKGPDVTFEYNDEDYAIEVETGSLLRKKHQLREKLNYLDKKYPNRWMFVVSHRKLLGRYKKYGMTSNRVQVLENIKKMLKNNIRIY